MKYLNKLTLRNAPRGALLSNPLVAAAAIGAGASLLNGSISQMLGRSNMDKQNEMARQNMLLSNELNRRNAMEQGVLQRQAIQGAGLNINADKAPFQTAGSSALAPSAQSNPQFVDAGVLQSILGSAKTPSEIKSNIAGAGKAQEEAKTLAEAREAYISEIRSRINLNFSQSTLNQAQSLAQTLTNVRIPAIQDATVENLWSEKAVKETQSVLNEANVAQLGKNLELLAATIKNIQYDNQLKTAQKAQAYALAYKARMEGMFTEKQAKRYDEQLNTIIALNKSLAGMNEEQKNHFKALCSLTWKQSDWYDVDRKIDNLTKTMNAGANVANAGANVIEAMTPW